MENHTAERPAKTALLQSNPVTGRNECNGHLSPSTSRILRFPVVDKAGAISKNDFGMLRLASHIARWRLFRPDPRRMVAVIAATNCREHEPHRSTGVGIAPQQRHRARVPSSPIPKSEESQRDRGAASSSKAARVLLKKPFLSRLVALNVAQRALSLLGATM